MNKNELPVTQSQFVNLLLDAVCVVDGQGRFVFVSAAGERIFGYTPEEMVGMEPLALVHPEDRGRTRLTIEEILSGQAKPYFENRYVRKDGSIAHIMWSASFSEADQLRVAVARDVTELKHAEAMQKALYEISEAVNASVNLASMLARIHKMLIGLVSCDGFLVALCDPSKQPIDICFVADPDANAPDQQVLARSLAEAERSGSGSAMHLVDNRAGTAASAQSADPANAWLTLPLQSDDRLIGLLAVYSQAGKGRFDEKDTSLLRYVATQLAGAIKRKQNQANLEFMASHDALTGLPNRALFSDRLETALAMARRDQGHLAILFVDLHRFKQVNDNHGHEIGDRLLQAVARRLAESVRESDTVARLGGDEFVVLLANLGAPGNAAGVAEKLMRSLTIPYQLGDLTLHMTPSVGLALYPEDGEDAVSLLRHADDAMYREKHYG